MRVAIPQWQGRVSPVFDVAGSLLIVDLEDGRESQREEVRLARTDVSGRAEELTRLGVDVLVCGAISATLEARLAADGVRVIGFVCGVVKEILAGFLNGALDGPSFRMPGCRRSRGGMRKRGFGGRRRMGPDPDSEGLCPKCGEPLTKARERR